MLSPGTRLGNFEIVAPLRAGGMASLYLARRRGAAGFDRPVAIKVIHGHLSSDHDFVEMFLDEARLAAKIQDPHVVHVEELGEDRGTYFLVMEYVHGRSLAETLKALSTEGRRMSPACAVYIASHVARGLEAAHEALGADGTPLGVVHRDVSPHNVLISFRGHVKLIDFGIAKARGQSRHTTGDSLRGKLPYMSPEQAFGKEIDSRSDVYALGIVLWEMLTGKRLFTAANEIALLDRVRAPDVAAPSTLVPALPSALDDVVMSALEPDRDRRIDTAKELARSLAVALPSALSIGPGDLAALLEAVAPDDKPPSFVARSAEPRPSVTTTRVALDTLSIQSESTPRPKREEETTGSAVVALEAARDAAVRWRRRTVGIAAAFALGLVTLGTFVVLARSGTEETRPTAPASSIETPVMIASSTSPPSVASDPVPPSSATAPPVASAPRFVAPRPAPSAPASSAPAVTSAPTPARSVERINGVPIVNDPSL